MPIPYLRERRRFQRLGKIRLGEKVDVIDKKTRKPKTKNGKPITRPKATDHFVVPDEVAAVYETTEPKTLNIRFLFESDDDTFPQFLKLYRGDGQLRCMGDGEIVYFRRFFDGRDKGNIVDEVLIEYTLLSWGEMAERKDDILETWAEQYGVGGPIEWNPRKVECLGEKCPQFGSTGCRATGRLLFKIDEIDRLGFWEMVVHQHAIIGINSQLDLCRAFTRQFLGRPTILHVPFKLHLRGPEKMKINGMSLNVYTPEIEPDPEWITEVRMGAFQLPAPAATAEDIWPPQRPSLPEPPPVPPEETEALDYEPSDLSQEAFDFLDEEESEPSDGRSQ